MRVTLQLSPRAQAHLVLGFLKFEMLRGTNLTGCLFSCFPSFKAYGSREVSGVRLVSEAAQVDVPPKPGQKARAAEDMELPEMEETPGS